MKDGIAAQAFEFAILTAARIGEAIGAHWKAFDLLFHINVDRQEGQQEQEQR